MFQPQILPASVAVAPKPRRDAPRRRRWQALATGAAVGVRWLETRLA